MIGTPRVLPHVDTELGQTAVGIAHVGDDRYVVGWIESGFITSTEEARLYAMQVDLAADAMRPAPRIAPIAANTNAARRWRCP